MGDIHDTHRFEDLVSIIMPTYNCGNFIGGSLDSVISQTYKNWEIIIVDDCSTDDTEGVVKKYSLIDDRIKYYKLKKNSGAAVARNKAVDIANGTYIGFLDSDDLWFPEKLKKQISFMEQNKCSFSCTSYTKINENGDDLNHTVKAKKKSNYNDILKRCPGNSTVIYNASVLGKFKIPDIRKRNDYVMWLQVIKKAAFLYGIEEPLGSYRIREGSLSVKKVNLVKYQWKVYREIEQLSVLKSIYLIIYKTVTTICKF
jgi:teichuronic acid biosynthesis glycosyltransferase TuaG